MTRVEVRAELLDWALARARLEPRAAAKRFAKLPEWRDGSAKPTLKQLEQFARATYTPIGYFFLAEPPTEEIPIPDFRTVRDAGVARPSADLLDTIYICQQRQDWYREYSSSLGEVPLPFVGSIRIGGPVVAAAAAIRRRLEFGVDQRHRARTWEDALSELFTNIEDAGILVMRSGIVANNTRRRLDPDEFRGFALVDQLAPVIFINSRDTKAAQMFTLAHELVHVWAGQTALSDARLSTRPDQRTERWCNEVAAELLVPIGDLEEEFNRSADRFAEMKRLARRYKVSTLVVLRRMHDAGGFGKEEFWEAFETELDRLRKLPGKGRGGSFHDNERIRVSETFSRALVSSTLEGQTLFRDAFRLLAINKTDTFMAFGRKLGVVP